MNEVHYLRFEDLQAFCDERTEESLTLEFKPCNELKVGTSFTDKTGRQRARQRDDVLDELTKDVTAFLNSAGGTIIYGILERNSCAREIDEANSFKTDDKQDNVRPEKVTDWLRDHIKPPPAIEVYRVFESGDPESPWYLVIEVPQGQQAYMAKDHKFYKRVAATVKPMEQYEVVDVMNRTRAAVLDRRIKVRKFQPPSEVWGQLRLDIEVTSNNFVASEYGALKLTIAHPLKFSDSISMVFTERAHLESTTELPLGAGLSPRAQSIMVRWGAHQGNIVFPGDWYNFYGNGFHIDMPDLSLIPNPTYLFQLELFTMNSQGKKELFAIRLKESSDDFEIINVDASNRDSLIELFRETCQRASELKQLKGPT